MLHRPRRSPDHSCEWNVLRRLRMFRMRDWMVTRKGISLAIRWWYASSWQPEIDPVTASNGSEVRWRTGEDQRRLSRVWIRSSLIRQELASHYVSLLVKEKPSNCVAANWSLNLSSTQRHQLSSPEFTLYPPLFIPFHTLQVLPCIYSFTLINSYRNNKLPQYPVALTTRCQFVYITLIATSLWSHVTRSEDGLRRSAIEDEPLGVTSL